MPGVGRGVHGARQHAPPEPIGAFRKRIDDAYHRRARGHRLEPRQGAVSQAEVHQARSCRLLPRGGGGRAARCGRAAEYAGALSQWHRRALVLSEARPRVTAALDRSRDVRFPSGRTADEVVPRTPAALAWLANLACLELHPHPVRAEDLDHPDERRVDLDPVPGIKWPQVRQVAQLARAVLEDVGLVGWPKTSGSRGMHLFVRIERRWEFDEVRRAALGPRARGGTPRQWARDQQVVEGRASGVSWTTTRTPQDRTVASAYSVRPTPDARVSAPLLWE